MIHLDELLLISLLLGLCAYLIRASRRRIARASGRSNGLLAVFQATLMPKTGSRSGSRRRRNGKSRRTKRDGRARNAVPLDVSIEQTGDSSAGSDEIRVSPPRKLSARLYKNDGNAENGDESKSTLYSSAEEDYSASSSDENEDESADDHEYDSEDKDDELYGISYNWYSLSIWTKRYNSVFYDYVHAGLVGHPLTGRYSLPSCTPAQLEMASIAVTDRSRAEKRRRRIQRVYDLGVPVAGLCMVICVLLVGWSALDGWVGVWREVVRRRKEMTAAAREAVLDGTDGLESAAEAGMRMVKRAIEVVEETDRDVDVAAFSETSQSGIVGGWMPGSADGAALRPLVSLPAHGDFGHQEGTEDANRRSGDGSTPRWLQSLEARMKCLYGGGRWSRA
jgi:hypothetical protein